MPPCNVSRTVVYIRGYCSGDSLPIHGNIEYISWLHYAFVTFDLSEVGEFVEIGVVKIYLKQHNKY